VFKFNENKQILKNMNKLKWLKTQLENNSRTPHHCEIKWKDLDELFQKAEELVRSKGITFQITEDHLKLLKHSYVVWWGAEYGAPAIDPKRPYGDSSVESDIAEILEWAEEDKERAENIHREMKTVLQIILVTQKFEPGLYHLENPYTTDWVKI
jgi:hypothetical protein